MKKGLKAVLFAAFCVILISGCAKNEDPSKNLPDVGEDVNTQNVVIKAEKLSEKIKNLTTVASYKGDLDGDDLDETITLSTSAERKNNGEFIWNDGQNWALFVNDGEEIFVLLDDFIQAGNVYFEVSDYYMEDGKEPKISVIVSMGAGFSVKNYTFSGEESGYVEETIFDTKTLTKAGINRLYSSFPEIIK